MQDASGGFVKLSSKLSQVSNMFQGSRAAISRTSEIDHSTQTLALAVAIAWIAVRSCRGL
jgi:hypothetical protein